MTTSSSARNVCVMQQSSIVVNPFYTETFRGNFDYSIYWVDYNVLNCKLEDVFLQLQTAN